MFGLWRGSLMNLRSDSGGGLKNHLESGVNLQTNCQPELEVKGKEIRWNTQDKVLMRIV
jgi:hypothetical protein